MLKIKGSQLQDVAKPGMLLQFDDSLYIIVCLAERFDKHDLSCCRLNVFSLECKEFWFQFGFYEYEDIVLFSEDFDA